MGTHSHGVEGWGDTIFGPELRLAHGQNYHLQFSPMFSAPTGRVDFKTAGVFTHYGMQLGSGTWDFWPSITYTGRADRLTWGTQVLGIVRMEEENESGYRLGDVLQITGWVSYRFANWISASVRGLYTEQGEIEGHYNGPHNHSSPPDLQFNYGGRFWDIGFGVNTVVPGGPLKGLRLSAEWLQPWRTTRTAISSIAMGRYGPTRPYRSSSSARCRRRRPRAVWRTRRRRRRGCRRRSARDRARGARGSDCAAAARRARARPAARRAAV